MITEFDFESVQLETSAPVTHQHFDLMYELPDDSAKPGHAELFTYQRDIVDSITNPDVRNVTLKMSAQTGKTFLGTILAGHNAINDPHTMMVFFPTAEYRDEWLRTKLAPYVRSNPGVQLEVPYPSSPGWNKTHIAFRRGGGIVMRHAGTKNAFGQTSTRTIVADEIDKWDTPGVSDPYIALTGRTTTYARTGYKILVMSTPNWQGPSRVAKLYNLGNRCRFWTPCWACGQYFVLDWEKDVDVEEGVLNCRYCPEEIPDARRWAMLEHGEWRPDSPDVTEHHSYVLGQLQSPFVPLNELIKNFNAATAKTEFMAEKMAIEPDIIQVATTAKPSEFRTKAYRDRPFEEVQRKTAGIDVQHDKLVYTIMESNGKDGDSLYHIPEHSIVPLTGPGTEDVDHADQWAELHRLVSEHTPERVYVDAGDRQNYVLEHMGRLQDESWFPIKGKGPSFGEPVITSTARSGVLNLGVDQLKVELMDLFKSDKLTVDERGVMSTYPSEFTAERLDTIVTRGHPTQKWVKKRKDMPNEAWDCAVYAFAAQQTHFLDDPFYDRTQLSDTMDFMLRSLQ